MCALMVVFLAKVMDLTGFRDFNGFTMPLYGLGGSYENY